MLHENGAYHPNTTLKLCVIALVPAEGKTPWWAKSQEYSHLALLVGDHIWDQPIHDIGGLYDMLGWAQSKNKRRIGRILIVTAPADAETMSRYFDAVMTICDRKGQPIRTVLRYLGLWPKPAWNCTSPVRAIMSAMGIELRGETPDDIINELTDHPSNRVIDYPLAHRAD